MFKSFSNLALILTLCPFIFQQQQQQPFADGLAIESSAGRLGGSTIKQTPSSTSQSRTLSFSSPATSSLQMPPPSAFPSTPQTSPMSAMAAATGAAGTRSHSSTKRDISLSSRQQQQQQHHHHQQQQAIISEYKSNFSANYADQHLPQSARQSAAAVPVAPARQKKTLADQWLLANSLGSPTTANKKPSELFKSSIVQRDLSHKFQHHFTPTSNHLGRPLFEPSLVQPPLSLLPQQVQQQQQVPQQQQQQQQQQLQLRQQPEMLSNFSRSLIGPFNRPNFLDNISKAGTTLFNGSSVSSALLNTAAAAAAAAATTSNAGSGMINSISRTQPVKLGAAATLFELGAALSGSASERLNSIVRTGPILTHHHHHHHGHHLQQHPLVGHSYSPTVHHPLRALIPGGMTLFAQHAQEDQHSRTSNHLRPLSQLVGHHPARQQRQHQSQQPVQHHLLDAPVGGGAATDFVPAKPVPNPVGSAAASGADQMIANANQLGVTHLGPQVGLSNMGASESNSYNSIASLQDYPPDRQPPNHHQNVEPPNGQHPADYGMGGPNSQQVSQVDDQRGPGGGGGSSGANGVVAGNGGGGGGGYNDYQQVDQNHYDPNQPPMQKSASQHVAPTTLMGGANGAGEQPSNSRSSVGDGYTMRAEHKSSRGEGPGVSNGPLRTSIDSFEEMTGLPTSEYERDLADLDEEFSRQSYRRPSGSLMSDSFMSLSPERYEGRPRYRRPNYADYSSAAEYLNTAGSMSSIVPRSYQRSPLSWASQAQYADSSDLWSDSNVDFSPLGSYVSPNHAYATYRWRPRYQRVSPYSSAGQHYALAQSASEQQLQPATYNLVPSYSAAPAPQPQPPTETISIALSPLAAAAAAAASALAAADKTRHHNHGWLTLPRITTTTNTLSAQPSNQAQASTQPAAAMPTSIQAAYFHRPAGPYALGSMPIYAIAPRPAAALATAAAPQGAAATSYIPTYFHAAGAPAIIAYRPTGVMPTGSLLTSASFAYPLRLPVVPQPMHHLSGGSGGVRANGARPFYSDLQYAETKPKSNLNNNNNNNNNNSQDNNKGSTVKVTSLSAMAKNLTKKMFGSASQVRPQHVSPPNEFSFLTSSSNVNSLASSTSSSSSPSQVN